ncbi:MAG TPA: restriction endonuclease subunit S [Chloroflexi bacterium]|nr:restriction endonuclease subunit S [Chloroflexota bacterium]
MSATEVRLGYKLTEVGVIPDDWEVTKIDKIAEKVGSGITPTGGSRVYQLCGRPFIRSQNVGWGQLLLDDIAFIDEATHASFNSTEIKSGDVLLNITGASIGRSAVADQRIQGGNVNQHVCIIRTHQEKIAPHFLNAVLLSEFGQRQIEGFQAGGNRQGLNFGQIRSFQVPLPPLPEQRAIAAALGDVDALLAALERLIAKRRAVKQAAMDALLSGRVRLVESGQWTADSSAPSSVHRPLFTVRYKLTEVGEIPEDWEVRRVQEIAQVKTGPFGSALHERDYVDDGTPIITVEHIGEFGIAGESIPMVSETDKKRLSAYELKEHDIVFSRVGAIDRNALIQSNEAGWLFSGRLLRVRPDPDKVYAPYLSYHFHTRAFKERVKSVAVGQTMPSLNTQILNSLLVVIPPLPEQRAIAGVLSDMDAAIAALERQRAKVQAIKQGMMQELLTGRIRLVK